MRLGSPDEFACVRDYLRQANFTEQEVLSRVKQHGEFAGPADPSPRPADQPGDTCDLLIALFVMSQNVAAEQVRSEIPEPVLKSLFGLGLLAFYRDDNELIYATVSLSPAESLYCIADRWIRPDGQQSIPEDAVYPPATKQARMLQSMLPRQFAGDVLDIGSGSGFFAFLASARGADRAWASDIAERCSQFAEFNRRLNGLENITIVTGDLYQALGDQTFDRIVAHPPYVPVLTRNWIFHDGGEDGESITRGIIQGLPRHLRPGGRCFCKGLGTDREDPFELRIREWLGEEEDQFDVLVVAWEQTDPLRFLSELVLNKPNSNSEEYLKWVRLWQQIGIRNVVSALVVVQRLGLEEQRETFTVRRVFSPKSTPAAVEWLLRWEASGHSFGAQDRIFDYRPRVSPCIDLLVKHRWKSGRLAPSEYRVHTEYPFANDGILEPWMTALLQLCDGQKTTREILQILKGQKIVPETAPSPAFGELVSAFVSRGFLELEEFTLPEAEE